MKKLSMSSLSLTFAMSVFGMSAYAQATGDLSYTDFLESCKNPATYGHQRPPENIRIACKDVQNVWEPMEAGATPISESRSLSVELFSDKYHVALQNFVVAVPEFNVACPRLREVVKTSQIEKSFTCVQAIAETRELKDVCLDAINEAIAANPDLVAIVPTGKMFNTCEDTVQKP